MDVLIKIIDTVHAWLPAITGLISSCAVIATLTPSKTDDKVIQKILDVINFIGLNIGKEKPIFSNPFADKELQEKAKETTSEAIEDTKRALRKSLDD